MTVVPAALLALASLVAVAPPGGVTPPQPPARFRGPEAIGEPLDVRMARDGARATLQSAPDAWCPAGEDFQRWLKQRGLLAPRAAGAPAKSAKALPNTWISNNIVVMEDDGTLTRYDRRPDLAGLTLVLTPGPGGYAVDQRPLIYDSNVGAQLWADQRGYFELPVDLTQLTFPFGGVAQARAWLTSTGLVAFADANPPGPAQLHLGDVLSDRLPRLAALANGTSLYGWNLFFREAPGRAVFTWRANDGGALDADYQVTLLADGTILLSYRALAGVLHGSVVVIDGNASWWADLRPGGSATSPPDEVTIPAPDGPALDITEVRAFQIAGSEMLQVEVVTQAPLPAVTDSTLQFAVELRDEPGGPVYFTAWGEWQNGRWNWGNVNWEVNGNVLSFRILRTEQPLTDDDLNVVAWTAQAWNWQQAIGADLAWPVTPPQPMMSDFSTAPFAAPAAGPLIECFTLPELQIGPIYDAFMQRFGSPRVDGLAVFQNFYTDIIFYAGAWSTVGNAGADGIGTGNTTDPQTPALLHMNTIRYGWNSWDAGKALVLNHEFGHHWLYFLSIMEGGASGKPLGDGHPAGWVHTPAAFNMYSPRDASCMGGSNWADNLDGTFTSSPDFASYGYTWHELYLMGLATFDEVTDWYYLRDSNPGLPGAYWPQANLTVTATRVDVQRQQMVDAMGPRVPDSTLSRKDFYVPFVLVVRPGEYVQADIDEAYYQCQVWEPNFHAQTLDRGTVTCDRVGDRPPVVEITDPPADVTIPEGTTLDLTGTGTDPDEDAVTLSWDFASLAPGTPSPGPNPVTFAQAGAYVMQLDGRDATGRDATPATRTITVTCLTPPEVTNLRVSKQGSDLAFTFDAQGFPTDEYVVGTALPARPPVLAEVTAAASGLTIPTPPERLVFLKVAARSLPDCLGPW